MSDIARLAGVTRQAVYLHFPSRADLLIATTHYLDEMKGSEARLLASRTAGSGVERLDAFIQAWGEYIPEIYGIAKALLAMSDSDDAANDAWNARMQDMKEGCQAAIGALEQDNMLAGDFSSEDAVDILWTLLSVRNWEHWTIGCGWSQEKYLSGIRKLARSTFVKP